MPLFSYQRLLEETPIWGFWTWGLDKKPLIRLPRELLPKVQGHVCFKPKRTDDAQRKPEKLSLKKKGIGSEARGTRQQNYEQRVKIIVIKADPVTNQALNCRGSLYRLFHKPGAREVLDESFGAHRSWHLCAHCPGS